MDQDKVDAAVAYVFEHSAFMFAETADMLELESEEHEFFSASVSFKGPLKGRIDMMCPVGIARELAANMLGCDADEDEAIEKSEDAFMEVLNVLAGHLTMNMTTPDDIYNISSPSIFLLNPAGWTEKIAAAGENDFAYLVDGFPLVVTICCEE